MPKQKSNYISLLFSSVIFLVLWFVFTNSSYNASTIKGINANILFYALDVIIFGLIYYIFYALFGKVKLDFLNNQIVAKWVPITEAIFVGCILIWNYFNENKVYLENSASGFLRHNIFPLIVIVLFGLLIVFVENIEIDYKKSFRWIISIALSAIAAICSYVPNPFNDNGGIYHIDAYVNSIINLVNGAPYSDLNQCIYGHYAILYAPLVKLIGGYNGIAVSISIFSFVTVFAFCVAGILIIKSNKLFSLYSMALLFIVTEMTYMGVYYQCFPHRIIFPALVICWSTFVLVKDKNGFVYDLIGSLICLFSIVWNFETGLVCLLSYTILLVLRNKTIKSIFISILLFILSLVGSYGFVNFLNRILGGNILSIKDFIYPLLSTTYSVTDLSVEILPGLHTSSLFTLVLSLILFVSLKRIITNYVNLSNVDYILLLVSLNALGVYVYGINRPAYGSVAVGLLQFILAITLVADNIDFQLDELFVKNTKIATKKMLTVLLAFLAIESIIYTGINLLYKVNTSWKTGTYEYINLNAIDSVVPKGTPAIGIGANIIYESLERDNIYYCTDIPDITPQVAEYISDDIMNYEYIFAGESSGDFANITNFEAIETFEINGFKYYYCKNLNYNNEE